MSILSEEKALKLPSTPSLVISNLTSAIGKKIGNPGELNSICYIHNCDVHILSFTSKSNDVIVNKKVDVPKRSQIHQVNFIQCCNNNVALGVATDQGFQLWSSEGARMLWFQNIDDIIGHSQEHLTEHRQNDDTSSTYPLDLVLISALVGGPFLSIQTPAILTRTLCIPALRAYGLPPLTLTLTVVGTGTVHSHFIRGITSTCVSDYQAHICIGTSKGTIFIYSEEGEKLCCLSGAFLWLGYLCLYLIFWAYMCVFSM